MKPRDPLLIKLIFRTLGCPDEHLVQAIVPVEVGTSSLHVVSLCNSPRAAQLEFL